MKPTKENTLYLPIKQVYFDQIIAGTKTKEFREIKETTYKKYIECDEYGDTYYDDELMSPEDPLNGDICIWNNGVYPYIANERYHYLALAVGYTKERDTALVEIVNKTFEPILNVDGKPARFRVNSDGEAYPDENGDFCFWNAVLHLGRIIEVKRKDE